MDSFEKMVQDRGIIAVAKAIVDENRSYGLTETAPVATSARDKSTVAFKDETDRIHHRSMAGWSLPACEIRVVDP